ncbi:unnamed protein product [Effrenium voratum]|nr:unnamed protein product [Effrenium voratum]
MGVDLLARHGCGFLGAAPRRPLRAVFPATTPAALTTLATATWPGQHGMPGWELRDLKACEFPKEGMDPVQLTVLDSVVRDMRTKKPAAELGFSKKDIYIDEPWIARGASSRRMKFINAYTGTEFTDWFEGEHAKNAMTIEETAQETLGTPEGSGQAVKFFNEGVDCILESVKEADEKRWKSYVYMYTAHPDKHMHDLGTDHPEVVKVCRGINDALERLWVKLKRFDVTMIVTADHGHVTVNPEEMVTLPDPLLDCLEYANVGVHGKGRHGYFHCRSGRHEEFQAAWEAEPMLREHFILLPVDVAVQEGLFGPDAPVPAARPRLGDFLSISLGAHTLVSPNELTYKTECKCQGAHGSLTPTEMNIPLLIFKGESAQAV